MKNNKSQKGIVVLLSFIAVCMVCIIVLLVSSIMSKSKNQNDQDTELLGKEKSEKNLDDVLYHYEGELSDTPINPTAVENEWILEKYQIDGFNSEDIVAEAKQQILKQASVYECYANPTIIDCGTYPLSYLDMEPIIIDFHTKEHNMGTYIYISSDATPVAHGSFSCNGYWLLWTLNYNEFKPYITEDRKYLINANSMYSYNLEENWGYTNEDLKMIQKKTMEAVKQQIISNGLDKYYNNIDCCVIASMKLEDKDNIYIDVYVGVSKKKKVHVIISDISYDADSYYEKSKLK